MIDGGRVVQSIICVFLLIPRYGQWNKKKLQGSKGDRQTN